MVGGAGFVHGTRAAARSGNAACARRTERCGMTFDLNQFRGVFFEECFESLDAMEAALLKLNTGEVDAEGINTIFRGAHSIKGGSATFGFAAITAFTHKVESLLDEVRGG